MARNVCVLFFSPSAARETNWERSRRPLAYFYSLGGRSSSRLRLTWAAESRDPTRESVGLIQRETSVRVVVDFLEQDFQERGGKIPAGRHFEKNKTKTKC